MWNERVSFLSRSRTVAVHEPTGIKVAIKILNKQKLRKMDVSLLCVLHSAIVDVIFSICLLPSRCPPFLFRSKFMLHCLPLFLNLQMGEKVRTEIHILRQFQHPHVIRLYEVLETPTDIYR